MSNFTRNRANSGLFNLGRLFFFKNISSKTQTHLTKFYGKLMMCSFVCAMGM